MKAADDAQRPTAGELMSEEETRRRDDPNEGATREKVHEMAQQHREAVVEGRARVGEADPNAGQNAHDHGGTIHPKGG